LVDGSARADGIQWGYALGGLCFAVLAAFRLEDGSTLWASVFGLLALANAYLAVRFVLPPSLGGARPREAGQPGPASGSPEPTPEEMRRALEVYESRSRGWLAISIAGWVVTVGIILMTPPLALVTAALALFSAYRFRRCRRSTRILRRALALSSDGVKDAGNEVTQG
jgi:uncharacterized membrane protein